MSNGPTWQPEVGCGFIGFLMLRSWVSTMARGTAVLLLVGLVVPVQAAEPTRWAILLAGISGDPELQKEYLKEIRDLHATLTGPMGFPKDHVIALFDEPARDPGLIKLQSTRDNLTQVCRDIAAKARKEDLVFVFMTGHGSYEQNTYKLNLPGPDPTGDELAALFSLFAVDRTVVVNATNSSGGSLGSLSQPGRIVITSTKSGMERNQTHFASFFIEGLKAENGDTDKNERVSMLEAFAYAALKVEEYYSKEEALQTEHPILDDNGDGQGHDKPGPDNGDGSLARVTYMDAGSPLITRGALSPERQALAQEAQSLERQIEAIKYAKSGMPEEEYEKKLEALLLKLARINEQLRKK
jgi:hypothetical protein